MYEVEYKVEITETERQNLIEIFKKEGYLVKPIVVQNDHYVEAKESPIGGYDLKRYRDEGDKIFYTEKIWEDVGGDKVRKEIENTVDRAEFEKELPKYPNKISIQKRRQTFSGKYNGNDIHIDMDSIKFDHSPAERFFIEAEVLSDDKEGVVALRNSLADFLKKALGKQDLIQSPGMFNMAVNKL